MIDSSADSNAVLYKIRRNQKFVFTSPGENRSYFVTYVKKVGPERPWYVVVDFADPAIGRRTVDRRFLDFIVEVSLPKWNDMTEDQRTALVDHLLERCAGEEDEETGEYLWSLRDPDVQEFSTILKRHGIWHEGLTSFVQVAHGLDIASIVEEETGEDVTQSEGESVELDLNEDES